MVKELLGHDEAHAIPGTTPAWIILVILEVETVIKGDLLPCPDVPSGDDPNTAVLQKRLTIRRAAMVDQSRGVPVHVTIQVLLIIQHEDILVVRLTTAQGFGLGNPFAHIFDDLGSCGDILTGKASGAVNSGRLKHQPSGFCPPSLCRA